MTQLIDYVYYDDNGKILLAGTKDSTGNIAQRVGSATLLEFDEPKVAEISDMYVEGGSLVKLPEGKQRGYIFDYTTKQWADVITEEERLAALDFKAATVRLERDKLLQETDFVVLSDVVLSDKQAWLAYRQALRDVTSQSGFPENVIWPKAPA